MWEKSGQLSVPLSRTGQEYYDIGHQIMYSYGEGRFIVDLKRNILRREESRRSTPGQICTWVFAFPFPQHVRFFPSFLLLSFFLPITKLFTRLLATTLAIKNVQDHPCSSAMRSKSCINSCNCSRNVRNFSGACSSFFSHFSISPSAELRESRSTSSII